MPPAVHAKPQHTTHTATETSGALGKQGLRLVPQIGERLQEIEEAAQAARKAEQEERRKKLQAEVRKASIRPAPGSSDLLNRPLRTESLPGIAGGMFGGLKLRMVESHDLTAMMPIHLKRGGTE